MPPHSFIFVFSQIPSLGLIINAADFVAPGLRRSINVFALIFCTPTQFLLQMFFILSRFLQPALDSKHRKTVFYGLQNTGIFTVRFCS